MSNRRRPKTRHSTPLDAAVEKIASLDRRRLVEPPAIDAAEQEEPTVELEPTADEPTVDLEPAAEEPTTDAAAAADADAAPTDRPRTRDETLARVDSYWRAFHSLTLRFPRTRIDEPLAHNWTRKQMIAHVAAWHDRTTDRLLAFAKSGAAQPLTDDIDAFNARVARAAIGRTSGEVVGALEASFGRLRRQIGQLTDEQLRAHRGWAAAVIAGNTYDHYDEHAADLQPAGLSSKP